MVPPRVAGISWNLSCFLKQYTNSINKWCKQVCTHWRENCIIRCWTPITISDHLSIKNLVESNLYLFLRRGDCDISTKCANSVESELLKLKIKISRISVHILHIGNVYKTVPLVCWYNNTKQRVTCLFIYIIFRQDFN